MELLCKQIKSNKCLEKFQSTNDTKRKLAPARVSYRHDFLISYRVYMMTGLFHILLFEGTLHVDKMHV